MTRCIACCGERWRPIKGGRCTTLSPPCVIIGAFRGCSSMVEHQLPKLTVRVRFSSPAPMKRTPRSSGGSSSLVWETRRDPSRSGSGSTDLVTRPGEPRSRPTLHWPNGGWRTGGLTFRSRCECRERHDVDSSRQRVGVLGSSNHGQEHRRPDSSQVHPCIAKHEQALLGLSDAGGT